MIISAKQPPTPYLKSWASFWDIPIYSVEHANFSKSSGSTFPIEGMQSMSARMESLSLKETSFFGMVRPGILRDSDKEVDFSECTDHSEGVEYQKYSCHRTCSR